MMMRATSLLAVALSVVAVAAAASSDAAAAEAQRPNVTFLGVPRSVEKELLALNATGKKFQCMDDRKTQITFDKVNDNYCDCPNGADEPGTAACAPQGRFYCRNKGFVGAYIPSSRVLDSVCDCCDGSDEAPGKCANNCTEIAAAARAARAEQIALFEAGAAKKKEYVKAGAALVEARLAELASARVKHTAEEGRLRAATQAKEAAEAAEAKEQAAKVAAGVAQLKTGLNLGALKKEEVKELYEKLKGRRGKVLAEVLGEMRKKLGIKEEEEAPASEGADDDEEEEDQEDFEEGEEEEEEEQVDDLDGEGEAEAKPVAGAPQLDASLTALLELVEDGVAEEGEAAKAARSEFRAAQSAVDEVLRRVEELEELDGEDFGDDQEFASLHGKCFSKQIAKYTYEVCPYKEAHQKEGGGKHGTLLGKWAGMERLPGSADGATPATFKWSFSSGAKCWNGPHRSMTATVSCGTEDEVLGVEEPSMCEYTMEVRTPAACAPMPDHLRLDLEWENEEDDEGAEASPRTEL